MEILSAYIPADRRQALGRNTPLPDRTQGAALFADISGFTPLTEALSRTFGPRRGAEELTGHLNRVYDAIIAEVDRFGGSVIAFAGDAITCWFDGDDGLKATASALAMQATMAPFSKVKLPGDGTVGLAVKAALASGPARRFTVGRPEIQVIDVAAGATLARMAAAGHAALRGEVVLDSSTADFLGESILIAGWRADEATAERVAVVSGLHAPVPTVHLPAETDLAETIVRPWLIPAVYERLRTGQGEFLTELRPAVALFLKFEGIDYDHDDAAGHKLNAYVGWVQNVLARYEGFLIDVAIGDKGSYLYCAFGAPIAHENDAWRALAVALELRTPPPEMDFIASVRIGISRGTMRTGAYGGTTRRTYGVLGDDVNLAARLMEHAAPGQVLVSGRVRRVAENAFTWEALPTIRVKGKTAPVSVAALGNINTSSALRLIEPSYPLPMVGRAAELGLIEERIKVALSGHGQVVGITAEAGMGKSRLVAEAIRLANKSQLVGYGGQCQSYGTNTSYLAWWSVWRGFFNLDSNSPLKEQTAWLEKALQENDPSFLSRLPLLGAALNLPIADNEVTRQFDAKLRKASLEGLLADCLRKRASRTPVLLVLEDCHWLDPLSHDLLEVIARTIVNLPVLLLVAFRPAEANVSAGLRVRELPHYTELGLASLTLAEAGRLVEQKLKHLFGGQVALSSALIQRLIARSQGNPFYLEELLNYLQDQGVDPADNKALEQLELPTSLHSLILSRIDQLSESQRITLKVASVVGRVFEPRTLWGASPQLEPEQVKADLEGLKKLDLTPLDKPEPELTYIFKHIVTQEVAYESLPFATRAMLHNEIGLFFERGNQGSLQQQVDLLAFHFDRSHNQAKKREYLLKAGEAAQARYANSAAIDYYGRVLPLLPSEEQVQVMLKLGAVHELVGKWKEAGRVYQEALTLAQTSGALPAQAQCRTATGELLRKRGLYTEAQEWLERARQLFDQIGDEVGVAQVLHYCGTVSAQQGDYEKARSLYENSLNLQRNLGNQRSVASLLSNLGILARFQNDFVTARSLYEESLQIRRGLGDRWAIANSLNNLGLVLRYHGDLAAARALLEESLAINRQVGDPWAIANSMHSLAEVTLDQGDFQATHSFLLESLAINRDLGDKRTIAFLFEICAELEAKEGQSDRALRLAGAASGLRESIGAPLSPAEQSRLNAALESACQVLSPAERLTAFHCGASTTLEQAIVFALERRTR